MNKISSSIKKKWQDVDYRSRVATSNKESHNQELYRNQISSLIKNKWEDPEYRSKVENSWTSNKRMILSVEKTEYFRLNRDKRKNKFIEAASKKHNNKYDYTKVEYTNSKVKVEIVCPNHGSFFQIPDSHLAGCGCPKCGIESSQEKHKLNNDEFILKAKQVHNNKYDYSKVEYLGTRDPIIIICPKHGEFTQMPNNHLNGDGCQQCAIEDSRLTTPEFVERAQGRHGDRYRYHNVDYINHQTKVTVNCPIHDEFEQTPNNHLRGQGCPKCAGTNTQNELNNYIESLGFDTTFNDRIQIAPLELDIYVPSKSIAIELHGLYWHSFDRQETVEEKMRHHSKAGICDQNTIKLIQIFENEWRDKRDVVESILKSKLGVSDKIYARKCEIRQISSHDHIEFMDINHIQGGKGCNVAYGLVCGDELVAVMSFNRHHKCEWEITRFANKLNTTVVGGASKLFKKFLKEVRPNQILTYADRRYSIGNLYRELGFELDRITKPNYFYVRKKQILSRQQFQKHKLKNKLESFDPNLTEAENMFNNGYRRIWDAGHYKFIWRR